MTTDSKSRIHKVHAQELKLKNAYRDYHRRQTPDKLPDDHSGHLLADVFGGSGNYDNLVSMNKDVNLRSYRDIERTWTKLLKTNSKIELKVELIYKTNSKRPDAFDIKYWVDGAKKFTNEYIENN